MELIQEGGWVGEGGKLDGGDGEVREGGEDGGMGRVGGLGPVRKDWFLPSTHMHPPICPTLSHTKRCHICSPNLYATNIDL